MPTTIRDIRQAREHGLQIHKEWKARIAVNDAVANDEWQIIWDDDVAEQSEPLVENVYSGSLEDTPAAEWEDVIQSNLSGTFHCLRAALPDPSGEGPRGEAQKSHDRSRGLQECAAVHSGRRGCHRQFRRCTSRPSGPHRRGDQGGA